MKLAEFEVAKGEYEVPVMVLIEDTENRYGRAKIRISIWEGTACYADKCGFETVSDALDWIEPQLVLHIERLNYLKAQRPPTRFCLAIQYASVTAKTVHRSADSDVLVNQQDPDL